MKTNDSIALETSPRNYQKRLGQLGNPLSEPPARDFGTSFSHLLSRIGLLAAAAGLLWTGMISKVQAWNSDYAYDLPKQRRMCATRDGDGRIALSAIEARKDCPPGTSRYVVVFGKEPRHSIGFVPTKTSSGFYPPLSLTWPRKTPLKEGALWHFTCVDLQELEVLGTRVPMSHYRGEITFSAAGDCFEAEEQALKFCEKEWKGQSLVESCLTDRENDG